MTTIPPPTMPRIHQTAVVLSLLAGGEITGGLPDALDIVFPLLNPSSNRYAAWAQNVSFGPAQNGPLSLWQCLDLRVDEERVVEFRHLPGFLSGDRLQPRRKRFVPLQREARDIAQNAHQLFWRHAAGEGNGIEARAADCGIREQRVNRKPPLAPPFRDN